MTLWNSRIEYIDPNIDDTVEVSQFLARFDLFYESDIDQTVVVKENNKLIGTGSISDNILKCIAVDQRFQGEGILNTIISELKDILFKKGINTSFVYTKRNHVKKFKNLGFQEIEAVDPYPVLMEDSLQGINHFQESIKEDLSNNDIIKRIQNLDSDQSLMSVTLDYFLENLSISSIIMNCNPITNGHLYLIEKAAADNDLVIIFILTEDKSLFPAEIRLRLAKEATANINNVLVYKGGPYILSYSTFPAYFMASDQEKTKINKYAYLDAKVFGSYFTNLLKINKRYVGSEPYSRVTSIYNDVLKEVMPEYGVELVEIKRKKYKRKLISASQVRKLIVKNKWEKIKSIVPDTTFNFLKSSRGKEIAQIIRNAEEVPDGY
jgi:[citrate (pro-3S)-lyase] ligase